MESLRGQVTCGRRSKTRVAKGKAAASQIGCPTQVRNQTLRGPASASALPLTHAGGGPTSDKSGSGDPKTAGSPYRPPPPPRLD